MKLHIFLALALGLAAPALEAATAKKTTATGKTTASSKATATGKATATSKPAAQKTNTTVKKGSSDGLRRIGDGPLGPFVEAPPQNVFLKLGVLNYVKPVVGYERALSVDHSWTAQLGFWGQGGPGWSSSVIDLMGSFRWWLGDHAQMQGFYLGPMAGLSLFNTSWDIAGVKGSYSATALGLGAEGGYQWILPAGVVLNAGLNAGFAFVSGAGAPSAVAIGGFSPVIVVSVGYAF